MNREKRIKEIDIQVDKLIDEKNRLQREILVEEHGEQIVIADETRMDMVENMMQAMLAKEEISFLDVSTYNLAIVKLKEAGYTDEEEYD